MRFRFICCLLSSSLLFLVILSYFFLSYFLHTNERRYTRQEECNRQEPKEQKRKRQEDEVTHRYGNEVVRDRIDDGAVSLFADSSKDSRGGSLPSIEENEAGDDRKERSRNLSDSFAVSVKVPVRERRKHSKEIAFFVSLFKKVQRQNKRQ